jgi:hypothetical protein
MLKPNGAHARPVDECVKNSPCGSRNRSRERRVKPLSWDRERVKEMGNPEVSYEEVMSGPEGMTKWVRVLHTHGYSIITGTPPTAEATQAVMAQFGCVLTCNCHPVQGW